MCIKKTMIKSKCKINLVSIIHKLQMLKFDMEVKKMYNHYLKFKIYLHQNANLCYHLGKNLLYEKMKL